MDDVHTLPLPVATSVAERLTRQIARDHRIGGRLPSEAELARQFEVSRVTVREALKLLAGKGMVSLSRGRRAIVTQPDGAMFGAFLGSLIQSDPRALFDLAQVRRSLEVQAVTLACRNASKSGLAAVDAALDAMRAAADDEKGNAATGENAFDRADVRFHQALALAGGNRVLTYLFEAMESALLDAFSISRRGANQTRAAMLALCDEHARLLDHVRAHDEKAAADVMIALIAMGESNLRSALG